MFPIPENVETEVRRSFSAVACWGEKRDEAEKEPVVVEEDVVTFSEEEVVVDDDKSEDNDPEFE